MARRCDRVWRGLVGDTMDHRHDSASKTNRVVGHMIRRATPWIGYVAGAVFIVLSLISLLPLGLERFIAENIGATLFSLFAFNVLFVASLSDEITSRYESLARHVRSVFNSRDLTASVRANLDDLEGDRSGVSRWIGHYYLDRVESILTRESFEVQGGQLFRAFYVDTFQRLSANPGPCNLIATASADPRYFWRNSDLTALFATFTKSPQRSLTRIFLVEEEALLYRADFQDVIAQQRSADITVKYVLQKELTNIVPRFVLVDTQQTFCWEVRTTGSGEIQSTSVTWNAATVADTLVYARQLLAFAKDWPASPTPIAEPEDG